MGMSPLPPTNLGVVDTKLGCSLELHAIHNHGEHADALRIYIYPSPARE